jgi:hypothetical protein
MRSVLLGLGLVVTAVIGGSTQQKPATTVPGLEFIDTSFENASPLWYDVADGVVRVHLVYDHERSSPNRAAGHIHFLIHAQPGSKHTARSTRSSSSTSTTSGTVSPDRSPAS